jgi:aerobic carbon-monoxide dehydrogenase small subunit
VKINFTLNGANISMEVPADRRAVDLLREDLGLTGTKEGCGAGDCGACTILVNGESRLSCLMSAAQLQDKDIVTIEGLAPGPDLSLLQAAFVEAGAVQCGFCTPGMLLAAADLLRRNPLPSRDEIRQGLAGNLCRCTGYQKIVDAVEQAVVGMKTVHQDKEPDRKSSHSPAAPAWHCGKIRRDLFL